VEFWRLFSSIFWNTKAFKASFGTL
jgi:hypothetical protein